MREIPEAHRRRYHIKEQGYPTDRLLDDLDDAALLDHMGVPAKYRRRAIAAARSPMDPVLETWVASLPQIFRPQPEVEDADLFGMGVLMHGPSGTYKTTTAAALLLRAVRLGIPNADPSGRSRWYGAAMGRYVGWQDVSHLFRSAVSDAEAEAEVDPIRQAMLPGGEMLRRGDFLVIDDISRERATEFNTGQLARLLRHRNEWGYPTILTTNHPPSAWTGVYGDVMASFLTRSFFAVEFS